MGGVRATHGGALLVLAALLLLLLDRLTARPRPHLQPPPSSPPPFSVVVTSTRPPAPLPPSPHPPPVPARNSSRPLLVRDLYVGGYTAAHKTLCPALGKHTRLLILVTSAPSNAVARAAVRLTWGHYAARSDVTIAFVLGEAPAALKAALLREDALYGDLIQGRFQDSYPNLPLKTLALLAWAAIYCPRAPRLLKTDDDMFVNVPRLLRFAEARSGARRTIWGNLMRNWPPDRSMHLKTYVSLAEYRNSVYPDFTSGAAYLVTADCVQPLLEAGLSASYLTIEDVFVTGVLAQGLNITRQHAPEFYNNFKHEVSDPCSVARSIGLLLVHVHEQFDYWHKLFSQRPNCRPLNQRKPKPDHGSAGSTPCVGVCRSGQAHETQSNVTRVFD